MEWMGTYLRGRWRDNIIWFLFTCHHIDPNLFDSEFFSSSFVNEEGDVEWRRWLTFDVRIRRQIYDSFDSLFFFFLWIDRQMERTINAIQRIDLKFKSQSKL